MTIERTSSGYLLISTIVNGYLFKRFYQGYTRREAVRLFKSAVRSSKA